MTAATIKRAEALLADERCAKLLEKFKFHVQDFRILEKLGVALKALKALIALSEDTTQAEASVLALIRDAELTLAQVEAHERDDQSKPPRSTKYEI